MTFDTYKKRLEANGGSIGNSISESTISSVNTSFKDSPDFKVVHINGVGYDARVVEGDTPHEKTLLFRPKTIVKSGNVILINSQNWLVTEFYDNEIYPKADITLCNNVLHIVTSVIESIDSYDQMGRPITTKTETYTDFPCVVRVDSTSLDEDNKLVISDGSLNITTNYNTYITEGTTFKMFNKTFKISNIDFTKVIGSDGVISLKCEKEN